MTRVVDSLAMMKIPLLGLVVNRIGGDDDRGYYGYHGGYGYGVGYGYTAGYGSEEEASREFPQESEASPLSPAETPSRREGQPRPITVPRRVA